MILTRCAHPACPATISLPDPGGAPPIVTGTDWTQYACFCFCPDHAAEPELYRARVAAVRAARERAIAEWDRAHEVVSGWVRSVVRS